jgi:hypothetical protein
MPKRSSSDPPAEKPALKQERRPRDPNALAFNVVREAVGDAEKYQPEEREKNPHAVALGRLGGKKGGKARAEKLTAEERREISRKAAAARWANRKSSSG